MTDKVIVLTVDTSNLPAPAAKARLEYEKENNEVYAHYKEQGIPCFIVDSRVHVHSLELTKDTRVIFSVDLGGLAPSAAKKYIADIADMIKNRSVMQDNEVMVIPSSVYVQTV